MTLGTILAPSLTAKADKPPTSSVSTNMASSMAPKLPTSTSIKPVEPRGSPGPTDTKNQQMPNFFKNNVPKTSSSAEGKSTETLTKNIPAGTTVTVKTVDHKQTSSRSSPSITT